MSKTSDQQRQLEEEGFLVLPDLMPAPFLVQLREAVDARYEIEGDQAGAEFKQEPGCRRLANLVNKGGVFRELIQFPRVLEWVALVLGDRFKLSSLNARRVEPGCRQAQPLHADMAALPDENGSWVCNTIWLLDDFTVENGAPRVIPGTHRSGKLPGAFIEDLAAPHPREVAITGGAGSVIVMDSHAWHGGTPNLTARPRTAVHAFYARWDKPQQQYQKKMLDQVVQDSMSPELRRLCALDDPENDRLSGADVVRSGFMK